MNARNSVASVVAPGREHLSSVLVIRILRSIRNADQGDALLIAQVENQGKGDAWGVRIRVTMTPFSDYILEDWRSPERLVGRLCPNDKQALEFTVFPKNAKDQFINVTFSTSYRDEFDDKVDILSLRVPLAGEKKELVEVRNPYVAGLPLDPRFPQDVFFGRREVIDFVLSNLPGRSQNNVLVLHGQRRAGKTSLLLQLRYKYLKPPHYPVFLDMQGLADTGTQNFLYRISRAITEALHEFGVCIEAPSRQLMLESGYAAFEDFLNRVCTSLAGSDLVLLFDEFEELEKRVRSRKLDPDLLSFIRSQMQHRRWIHFIFAGTHQLEELSKEYFGIFFNTALYHEIGLLSRSEAETLISEPVSPAVTFEDRAVKRIWSATFGHPYFIQLICYYLINLLVQEGRSQVSFLDVDTVIQNITHSEVGHLDYLWAQSSLPEQWVLSGIAELQRTLPRVKHFPEVEIRREIEKLGGKIPLGQFSAAIHTLIARGVLSPDTENRGYGITFELLSRWIREKHPEVSK